MSMSRDEDDIWDFSPLRRWKTKSSHSNTNSEACPPSQNKGKTKKTIGAAVCKGFKPKTTSTGMKNEKEMIKIKTERIATMETAESISAQYKESSSYATPVKNNTKPTVAFNFSQNQKNLKSVKKPSGKHKSTSKIKKNSSKGLTPQSWSSQATLSFENKKLIITPPKSTGCYTSKLITPTKSSQKFPMCSSMTKTLPKLHWESLSAPIVQKSVNTPSRLLNALNIDEHLTYEGEKDSVCSTQVINPSLSLGKVSNSLKRKELEEPSKRQLFSLSDSDDENKETSLKFSSSATLNFAISQELFSPPNNTPLKSETSTQLSSATESYEDSDSSVMSVPEPPSSSQSTVSFEVVTDDFQNLPFSSYLSPAKDVNKNLPLSDSGIKFETPTKSLNIHESLLKDSCKTVFQKVPLCKGTPIKRKILPSQNRVTLKSELQKADICSPTKSLALKLTNLKNSSKNMIPRGQTSLASFFQSKPDIPSNKIVSVSNPIQKFCPSTVSSSLFNESLLIDKTTYKKSLTCSSPKAAKNVLSVHQFKQLFHKAPTKQETVTRESSIPSSLSTISENYKERKFYFMNCPFYKKIQGTCITVDAFKYGVIPECCAYFLTHFHYDHYQGLTKHFSQPLYCSEVTANLVKLKIGVSNQFIHPLPLYCPVVIESTEVTLMDANHCPGSVLILFKYSDQGRKKTVLHTGDFRADSLMEKYDALKNVEINQLYLDTTYCDPQYVFPGQQEVLNFCVSLVKSFLIKNPHTLIVVGTYTIGKEKVFIALAEAIGSKIGVTKEKKRLLDCLQSITMDKLLTLDLNNCNIHIVKMNNLNYRDLNHHLQRYKTFNQLLALKPTGWTHSNKTASLFDIKPTLKKDKITIYGIPYSEHSSFVEMKRFVQFIRPDDIVPTVNNGNAATRKFMQDTFNSWLSE